MNLADYIKDGRGNAKALAEKMGISMSYLSQMASGSASRSPERCVLIERLTEGAVTRRELRPEDWHLIWPELITAEHPASEKAAA